MSENSKLVSAENVVKIHLKGSITTTATGYSKLLAFYSECKDYFNCTIEVSFESLNWIDANMVAILQGILYKLKLERQIHFIALLSTKNNSFHILFTNGFLNNDELKVVNTGTAVRLQEFRVHDEDEFVNYVENDLLDHAGLNLKIESKEIIIQAMIEIFANYGLHSQTDYPLFLCGQYYPIKNTLKFTIFDLGIGFLAPISQIHPHIQNYESAIDWALVQGNSTKGGGVPGGCGLSDLKQDLLNNNGYLEIISGDAYKRCFIHDGKEFANCSTINKENIGTTINLFFNGF